MKFKNFLMDSTALLLRGSVVVAFLLLFIQIANSSKQTFGSNSVHKTKEAKETKSDLYCFSCDFMSDSDNCVNINRTRSLNLTKKCDMDQSYCVVKRFSYTMSDKNSTSDKKLWSLQRDCTEKCENGCIVIGERVKLYACSSCCHNNLCNISSRSSRNHQLAFELSSLLLVCAILLS